MHVMWYCAFIINMASRLTNLIILLFTPTLEWYNKHLLLNSVVSSVATIYVLSITGYYFFYSFVIY